MNAENFIESLHRQGIDLILDKSGVPVACASSPVPNSILHTIHKNKPVLAGHLLAQTAANDASFIDDQGLPVTHFDGGQLGRRFGDGYWLLKTLSDIDIKTRLRLTRLYSGIYMQHLHEDPNPVTRFNHARRIANTWLREQVKNVPKNPACVGVHRLV